MLTGLEAPVLDIELKSGPAAEVHAGVARQTLGADVRGLRLSNGALDDRPETPELIGPEFEYQFGASRRGIGQIGEADRVIGKPRIVRMKSKSPAIMPERSVPAP